MWPLFVAVKGWLYISLTFSTIHHNFTAMMICYKMNTMFVFNISNNSYMRNLKEFCEVLYQQYTSRNHTKNDGTGHWPNLTGQRWLATAWQEFGL
ncbi:hypothetical protein Y032_0992g3329 [Ancylostoma ceylanicum]|uniref:Uncharacterized protein n=1 Tax=Ancylostoma ceylanicum TaxID=53326 RepID=A0A016W802_9BILA|nr:hypothetical protein Y032_0992g3329 [Ancylostoma ceylanicum]